MRTSRGGQNIDAKADRLSAAITRLANSLYNLDEQDARSRYENLKTYRAELFRGFIVHTQLAIEDLLKAMLFDFLVKQNRSLSNREARRIVDEMKSSDLCIGAAD